MLEGVAIIIVKTSVSDVLAVVKDVGVPQKDSSRGGVGDDSCAVLFMLFTVPPPFVVLVFC